MSLRRLQKKILARQEKSKTEPMPCPFCLAEPHYDFIHIDDVPYPSWGCGWCGCKGQYGEDEKEALELWNRREMLADLDRAVLSVIDPELEPIKKLLLPIIHKGMKEYDLVERGGILPCAACESDAELDRGKITCSNCRNETTQCKTDIQAIHEWHFHRVERNSTLNQAAKLWGIHLPNDV